MKSHIVNKVIFKLSKVYVVHSIPGRLRVKIPGLEHVKDMIDTTKLQDLFQRYRLKGVESFELSIYTSKVLIVYDEVLTNSERILALLNRMRELLFELFLDHKEITDELINELINSLIEEGYEFEGE